ncbi:ribosome biogenesis protein Nop10 [Sulfolobales archaeon HS-7]|nr:ribosome biogenesis protein Nop10 [Sulfolobales archaeon HS-7]
MKWKIRFCKKDRIYTLEETCTKCGGRTAIPHPTRFSPIDKYVRYRIENKLGKKIDC